MYVIEPSGIATSTRVRIVVPYGNTSGEISKSLSIYEGKDRSGPFERVPDSYVNAGFLQGSITQFGVFFAGYPKSAEQAAAPNEG